MKLAVASLSSKETKAQLLLLTTTKDVVLFLGDLIDIACLALGRSTEEPLMEDLKKTSKVSHST